jgi:virginiamycin B lyase
MANFMRVPNVLRGVVLMALCTGCVVRPPAAPAITAAPTLAGPHPTELVNLLRQGGYVIYFRHTKTDFTQKDTVADYDNCAGQRNLTDEGRTQAKDIGVAMKTLGIPVGRVVASPYCRTRETAQLAFGKYERADHYETAKAMTKEILSAVPNAGGNIIIVAHGFIIRDVAGVILDEGDAYIFKPTGPSDQGAIARVPASFWTDWAANKNTPPREVLRTVQEFDLPAGKFPHDVAPNADGTVWWTAQSSGELGLLDPRTGQSALIPLGAGSRPHGVIVGPDGAAWVTDGGLNAIVRVDAKTHAVKVFPLPPDRANANLNTAAFDKNGAVWFTGQSGVYGKLDVTTERITVWDAPKGRGPYGIAAAPDGSVYFASLAGSYIARIDVKTGEVTVIAPPTPNQGARRVWVDSKNQVWVSEWNSGQLSVYDPATQKWQAWKLPGPKTPQAYAVYVDAKDGAWVTDFGNNTIVNYSPSRREWKSYALLSPNANVRQLLGHNVETWHEIWGAESGTNKLVVVRAE